VSDYAVTNPATGELVKAYLTIGDAELADAIATADRAILMGDRTVPAEGYAADLRHLADWTGGTLLVATSQFEAARQAALLVAELRHQYILGIDAAAASGWRALSVRVRAKSAIVKARSGYFGRATG